MDHPTEGVPAAHVLLVCSGLDHAHRGYESFARECFEALRPHPGVNIELVKGSGPRSSGERSVPSLRRDHPLALRLGRTVGARPFRLEAFAFAFSLIPVLLRRRPDVVYLSEWDTARVLAAVRSATGLRFKLLFCNGGFAARGFEHLDHVQELTPAGCEYVLERGADPRKHAVLPMGVHIERELTPVSASQRRALRARLALPQDRQIVLSVAALNRHHKRLDYLIEEIASLPEPRPYLLLDGQPEEDTPGLRSLARERLGEGGHEFRTSPSAEVPSILRASDVFVLPSLAETQARALIEAMSHGLDCLAHDSPITRFALGDHGHFGDFVARGSLARLLSEHDAADRQAAPARAAAGHRHVYERFSWERLRGQYVELLTRVARGGGEPQPRAAKSTVSSSTGEKVSR